MDQITSASNSTVKGLVLLRQKVSRRRQSRSFVIEGERLVLDAPTEYLQEIYVTEKALEQSGAALEQKGLLSHTTLVSQEVMEKISDTKTPQGILAVARQPHYEMQELLKGRNPFLLLLEDIQDPGNLGTMFRTAEAAGVTGIVMSRGTVDVFNPKVVRSTMSAIFRQPFVYAEDFRETIRKLQQEGVHVLAACLEGSVPYYEAHYERPCAIAIGNEGNGLSEASIAAADERIRIPMQGQIESLNAAISAGILMYEAVRRQEKAGI